MKIKSNTRFKKINKKLTLKIIDITGQAESIEEIPDSLTVEMIYSYVESPIYNIGHELKLTFDACLQDFKFIIEELEDKKISDVITGCSRVGIISKRIGPIDDEYVEFSIDSSEVKYDLSSEQFLKISFLFPYQKFKEEIENFIKIVEKEKEKRKTKT